MTSILNAYTLIIDYDWCEAYPQWFLTAYLFVWMGRRNAGLVLHGERLDSGSYLGFVLES